MLGRAYRYLESLELLCNTQFGFRKGHSISHAMHHLVNNIIILFESGKNPLTILIGFKKAFDTVDFELLLRRLSYLGIRDSCLQWFRSYLHGSSMWFVINNTTSAASQAN